MALKSETGKMKACLDRFLSKYDDIPKFHRKRKYTFVFFMIILSIIDFAVFYVYVNLDSILMAFQEFTGYDSETFQATYQWSFANFARFWEDITYKGYASTSFRNALKNTLFLFVLGNTWSIPMQFLVSYFLYKKICGYKFFRWILYIPSIVSTVVIVTIFTNIVSANGLISSLSMKLGGEAVTYLLTTEEWAKWTVLLYNNWVGFAGSYIIITSAMMRVPGEIVDSAKLDGANAAREFFSITIPMIWPTIQIIILQKITGILTADGPILLLTGGDYDTYTIGFWFYQQVIVSHSFEYPSAIGLIMTCCVAPIAIIVKKLLDRVYADVEF